MAKRIGVLWLIFLMAGCSEDIEAADTRPERTECDIKAVDDWEAEDTLSWDAPLPVQGTYKDFEALFVDIQGKYDVKYKSADGRLTISRSDDDPYQNYDRLNCERNFEMPVKLNLTDGENTWEQTTYLLVAIEHIGYRTDRDVPEPYLFQPIIGFPRIDVEDTFPVFDADDERPSVRAGETRLEYYIELQINAEERVSLEVIANDTLTKNGVSGYERKPWFTLEGEKVE